MRRFTMTAPSYLEGWNIRRRESRAGHGSMRICWRKRCGQGVEAELAVQIAAGSGVKFVKTGNGAEHPGRIHGLAERFQFFRERSIAQDGFFQFGRKFKEIGEQAIENADLILEGGFAVLGEG